MAFTFDASLSTQRDRLRLSIGDTDSSIPEFQDETLDALLSGKTLYQAMVSCFDILIAKYSRYATEKVGPITVDYGLIIDNFIKLKKEAQKQVIYTAQPFAGGISSGDKAIEKSDSDVVQPVFTKSIHNNIDPDNQNEEEDLVGGS